MYWSDKPNVYLKSGDYGYDRYKLPWAHGPDRNPEWTKVFHIMNIIFKFKSDSNAFFSVHSCGSLTQEHNMNAAHGTMQPVIQRIMQAINIQKGTYAKFHKFAAVKRIKLFIIFGFKCIFAYISVFCLFFAI